MVDQATVANLTQEVIELIKQNTRRSNYEAWKIIQKHFFPKVKGFLRKRGIWEEELMQEIINDSLAALFQNVLLGKFRGDAGIGTYFTRIATNKWLKWLKDNRQTLPTGSQVTDGADHIGELDRILSYLKNELSATEKDEFKKQLAQDTSLQELVEVVKGSISLEPQLRIVALEEHPQEATADGIDDQKAEDMKTFIEKVFPPDHHCPQALIEYYFVHEANYDKMTYATKRSREDFATVYERVKKQINRCLKTLRDSRK